MYIEWLFCIKTFKLGESDLIFLLTINKYFVKIYDAER